jgi:hypothetical protein
MLSSSLLRLLYREPRRYRCVHRPAIGDPTRAHAGIKLLDFKPFNPVDKRTEITYHEESSGKLKRVTKDPTYYSIYHKLVPFTHGDEIPARPDENFDPEHPDAQIDELQGPGSTPQPESQEDEHDDADVWSDDDVPLARLPPPTRKANVYNLRTRKRRINYRE